MILDLLSVPVFYINLDRDVEKKLLLEKELKAYGFTDITRIPGVLGAHKREGVALAHLNALKTLTPPFLLLEDDCKVETFTRYLSVPSSSGAVFLGHMGHVAKENTPPVNGVNYWKLTGYEDLYKIQGVLSAHAILYLQQGYINDCALSIEKSLPTASPHDVFTGALQLRHDIVAVGNPIFSQKGFYNSKTNKHIAEYK
jgi:hypothetical protein